MENSEILLLKLSSGDEIIGECVETNGGLMVKNACSIRMNTDESGKQSIRFSNYCPYAKDATICVLSYLWVAKAMDEVESRFKEIFSPIIMPESKIQLV